MNDHNHDEKNSEHSSSWHDMCCGGGHHHKHFLLRLILGLFILGTVFCLGLKIGEFKGEIKSWGFDGYYGRGHMRNFNYPMMYYPSALKNTTSTPR